MPAPSALLLDADGTLVDSTYLHALAWSQALAEAGTPVETWRLHRLVGMGGPMLLRRVLGDRAEDVEERVTARHSELALALADVHMRALPGARDLLAAVRERGVRTVLATTAPADELEKIRAALDADDLLDAVTSGDDVEGAKPHPDLVQEALRRVGVGADRALYVGDATWDVESSGRAGVPCLGVLTGGISEAELRDAGAVAVYSSVADLLAGLDTSPVARLWG
ncbi:HAD family hydrolase [Cellulomonas endophytica]|uniref:HAD family hydrolase n=1 Tax=Cellulomonas endophytica TaxID=2494735 RepID=UPI0010103D6E|nr:HAD family hydrolase [Cellulomonas endophytica]